VGGRVAQLLPLVAGAGDDLPTDQHDGADRHVPRESGRPSLFEGQRHRRAVVHRGAYGACPAARPADGRAAEAVRGHRYRRVVPHDVRDVNRPEVVAEVLATFERYEAALVANDLPTLDELFWHSPHTERIGLGDRQHGFHEISAARRGLPRQTPPVASAASSSRRSEPTSRW